MLQSNEVSPSDPGRGIRFWIATIGFAGIAFVWGYCAVKLILRFQSASG